MNVPKIHFKLWANLKTGESLVQYQPNECRGRTWEKILKDEQFHGARAKEEAGDIVWGKSNGVVLPGHLWAAWAHSHHRAPRRLGAFYQPCYESKLLLLKAAWESCQEKPHESQLVQENHEGLLQEAGEALPFDHYGILVFENLSNLWFVKRSNVPDRPIKILPSRRLSHWSKIGSLVTGHWPTGRCSVLRLWLSCSTVLTTCSWCLISFSM